MTTDQRDDARPAAAAGRGSRCRRAFTAESPLPGLVLTAAGVAAAFGADALLPAAGTLMAALVLGAVLANIGLVRPVFVPGLRAATRTPMRAGIVLLGLQLALPDVLGLGAPVLVMVMATATVTFFGTVLMGRLLGIGVRRSLLIASGVSICGASAVAGVNGALDAEEDDVMTAVALVTIFGTAAVFALPLLRGPLGLDEAAFGVWAGAGVHEVGQVVAAAGIAGGAALAPAVVVKLTRVVLLAPLIVGVNLWLRRSEGARSAGGRPPIVPLFVTGFLGAVAVGALGVLPEPVLAPIEVAQNALLCAGLFAMGTSVRLARLVRTSGPSLLLGAAATLLVLGTGYVGVTALF
ncbi:putative integral membrane protein (TIGR00698 family) [Spinactinospora alkalitolerans]|uniref:Putative integral membrane protein (TIGR00698 family) n=1 Tax=Spinactinospora alkalitolerans TaxID=687207 RepID=A0A852TSI7_9ACTN|nr:putative sulfate exporter family transporter [Spinactinospora alkalitolerans]NYE46495.1 putative integral membrane protein (TIGR00698 family) [Spinactinospora alkalitolerans]